MRIGDAGLYSAVSGNCRLILVETDPHFNKLYLKITLLPRKNEYLKTEFRLKVSVNKIQYIQYMCAG
jgi:hypothetical protein